MKSIQNAIKFLSIGVLMFFAIQLKAQGNEMMENHKELAEQRFKVISEKLQLTQEQQTKLKAIAKENRMEMKQLRESKKDAPKQERRAAMLSQLKKANEQINAMLNPKQQELFSQYKAERKAHRQKKMKEKQEDREMMEDGRLF